MPHSRRRLVQAVVRRPSLWMEALRFVADLRCKEWWKPILLVKESEYLRWRVGTAYGDPEAAVDPDDLVRYLRWRRRQRAE